MNFQERFKGKTSQMSKDPISSITDTSDKMKVDFNNMRPCDVYEITRSYTPKVKSEVGVPTRNSGDFKQLFTTDKGQFRSKNISQASFQKQDNQNSMGYDSPTSQGNSMFSSLQNNFDSIDTITDIFSPVNVKKSNILKQTEKSKFLDSPAKVKAVNQEYITADKALNTPTKMQISDSSIFSQKAQMQNPQQILQARLAKERSQSNNFQRVGSYLTQSTIQQKDQFKKADTEKIISHESTPQIKNKRMQTETGEIQNFGMLDSFQSYKSVQNTSRSNNIEKNIFEQNYNLQRRMTEQVYPQNNQNNILHKEQFIGTPSRLTHSISKQNFQPKTSQLSQQNQQDEYYQQSTFANGGPFDTDSSQAQGGNNRRIRSYNGFQDSKTKLNSVQDDKQSDAIEDLEQFINGLNRNPQSQSSTFLQTKGSNIMNNNSSRVMQSQQLWMNTQLQKIIPVDSLQSQINQLQTKKEEEEALMAYKHQFNYKSRLVGRLTGNDSPSLSSQGVDSPSLRQSKQLENFQQVSESVTNNMQQSHLMQNSNSQNTPMNLGALRQKSYSSQIPNQNQSQRMILNIK